VQRTIAVVGKGEGRKNLENLDINELHKNWCYGHITNKVRFALLAAVIINHSIPVSVQCMELHIPSVSVQRMFITVPKGTIH
jgi:hypothetical protein